MKRVITLIILLIIFVLGVFAQSGNGLISGTIRDKDGYALPGATLRLDKHNRYTISDADGRYEFLNVPADNYVVEIHYLGYKTITQPAAVTTGKNTSLNIILEEESYEIGTVVVMGDLLRGQAKALNRQKTNSNISNVISSDQVGRFPDSNIGDALKRVTGVTMQNDQGEARNIIIRGLAPELNSVTLNGNRIPSAEGDNRRVQMDLIPSDMISSVEVSKTLTPDMDADAIGGSVDLATRATPDGQRISATLLGGYNPIREGATYSGSLIYGNRFFNNKLGMVLSASYQNKDYGSDNIEATWKNEDGLVYVEEMDIRKYDVQRVRRSFSGAFDYAINQSNSISLDAIYNWRDDRENRYRTRYRSIEPEFDDAGKQTGYIGAIRRETKGGIDNNRNKNRRLEDQRVQSYALKGQHLLSEKFDLDWNVSYSRASEDRPNERYMDFQQKDLSMKEDLSDTRLPFISVPDENMDKMKVRTISENHDFTAEDEWAMKLNARVPFSVIEDKKGRLRFGVRARFKSKERDNNYFEYEATDANKIGVLSSLPTSHYDWKNNSIDKKYIPGTFVKNSYLGNLDLKNPAMFDEIDVPSEYLSANYKANERILAGYVRWDQNITNKLLMIVGVRAEHTYIDYTGNNIVSEENEDEDVVYDYQKVSEDNSYLHLLPNLSFKYDASDDLVLRAAFTTALARPNYYSLVPYTYLAKSDEELAIGNPDLKATYSYNFDLMGEYYFKSVGVLTGGLFYKRLDNFIYTYIDPEYSHDKFARDFPNQPNLIPAGDDSWEFSHTRNGDKVDLFGFELGIQRKLDFMPTVFLRNFGVYLNYTYTYSKANGIYDTNAVEREGTKLPGMAPHMLNASLSWENKHFSARVSMNYSSDYIDEFGESEFTDSYYDKQLFVDANAAYKFNTNLRIFAEANNLTNQALRYYQGSSNQMKQLEYYKPTFNIGLKYDF